MHAFGPPYGITYILVSFPSPVSPVGAFASSCGTASRTHPPRPQSCFVTWEGLRSGRYWTFSLLDSGGALLVRLAALNRDAAERWLTALEAVGCVRDDSLIPPGGPKVRPPVDSIAANPALQVPAYVRACVRVCVCACVRACVA
jgi:hypothetical protein